jgi:hypothetical protein
VGPYFELVRPYFALLNLLELFTLHLKVKPYGGKFDDKK